VGSSQRPGILLARILGTCALLVSMQHASEANVLTATSSNSNGSDAVSGSNMLPAAPDRDLLVRVCTSCHAPEIVVANRHTPEEWDDIIAKMVDHGAQATDEEQQRILTYLVRFFGS
jgi:cytochrome c5